MIAAENDLPAILALQYLAYQSEAKLFNTSDIPPLKQTLPDVEQEYQRGIILKAVDDHGMIVGSVRAHSANATLYIGKLIVHPDRQREGIGTALLLEIERRHPDRRCELFTSSRSHHNIRMYERLGYKILKTERITDELSFVYLDKTPDRP